MHTALAAAGGSPAPGADRIARLQRKVAEAKARRMGCGEHICQCLGLLACLPTLGLCQFVTVPANTKIAIFRFGKLDRVLSTSGIHWIAPCYDSVSHFSGTQTHKLDSLNVIDAAGNPIIVRALLEYAVEDPAALRIATDNSLTVLFNMAEQVVREACSRLPLLGNPGHDIRTQTSELGLQMVAELQADASVFGVQVQRVVVVEARYAPEIASQMLMKQQAGAMVAAREQIVLGAMNIVRDTLREFPAISDAGKERLTTNLLVTLTSHVSPTPTIALL